MVSILGYMPHGAASSYTLTNVRLCRGLQGWFKFCTIGQEPTFQSTPARLSCPSPHMKFPSA